MSIRITKKFMKKITEQKIKPFSSFTFGVKRGDGILPSLIVEKGCSVLDGVEESITYSLYACGKRYGFVSDYNHITITNVGYNEFESFFSILTDQIDSYFKEDYELFLNYAFSVEKKWDIDDLRNKGMEFRMAHRKIYDIIVNPMILKELSKKDGRIRPLYFNFNTEYFANLIINNNKNYNFVMAKISKEERLDGECYYNELLNDRLYFAFTNLPSIADDGKFISVYGDFDKKVNDPNPIDNRAFNYIIDNDLKPPHLIGLGEPGYLINSMWNSMLGDIAADKELCDPVINLFIFGLEIQIDKENKQVEICTNTRDLRNYKYDGNNDIVKCLMGCYEDLSTLDKLRVITSLKQLKKCIDVIDKKVKNPT